MFKTLLPFLIGLTLAAVLYSLFQWWPFLILFPWIGLSISLGIHLRKTLKGRKRSLGRKISILMIMPILGVFIPVYNYENFQLEGIVLIVAIGFFGKGFIHYAIAKIFGPLIWGRGFCGWACWTAAIFDWLPVKTKKVPEGMKNIRYISLLISFVLPLYLIFALNYDVVNDYLNKEELIWMIVGSSIYYLIGIPLAFIYKDKRAFCKIVCPVSLVMTPSASVALIRIKPTGNECNECGVCNKKCLMQIDVRSYISQNKKITSTECILCSECVISCPEGAIN